MKKILLISFLTLPFLIFSQENQWRWQQEVDYKMVVDVNVEDHTRPLLVVTAHCPLRSLHACREDVYTFSGELLP